MQAMLRALQGEAEVWPLCLWQAEWVEVEAGDVRSAALMAGGFWIVQSRLRCSVSVVRSTKGLLEDMAHLPLHRSKLRWYWSQFRFGAAPASFMEASPVSTSSAEMLEAANNEGVCSSCRSSERSHQAQAGKC